MSSPLCQTLDMAARQSPCRDVADELTEGLFVQAYLLAGSLLCHASHALRRKVPTPVTSPTLSRPHEAGHFTIILRPWCGNCNATYRQPTVFVTPARQSAVPSQEAATIVLSA
jgi:hypothetical protein